MVQLRPSDPDIGLNGRVRYQLCQKDTKDGSFVVGSSSGIIRTSKTLDRESVAVYYLTTIAMDKVTPAFTGSIEVQVRLEVINDSPPAFESDKITLYVPQFHEDTSTASSQND